MATTYKIVSGDTLGAIAARNGTTVQALMQANPTLTDPNKIQAGAMLNIPGTSSGSTSGTTSGAFSLSTPLPSPGLLTSSPTPSPVMSPSYSFQAPKTASPLPTAPVATQNQQFLQATTSPQPAGYVQTPQQPGSLSGTMTGGSTGVTGKPVTSTVSSQPTGNQIKSSVSTPTVPGQGTQATLAAPNQQLNQSQFANVIDSMRSKLAYNNELINARQLLVTKLYDHPLTEAEIAKLPVNLQEIARSGDNRQVEMRIRLLNDEIQGRTNTMDQSINYLTTAYKDDLNRAEEQKQQALNIVLGFVESYGDQAGEAIKAMYGEDYLKQLEAYGINVGGLNALPKSLQQIKDEQESDGMYGKYSEDQLKVITKINQDVSKNATYAKTTSMRSYADNVKAALAIGNGVSDIAAINQFQKVIDEGAVTRDQDVVLIQGAQSLLNTLQTKIKGLEKGDKLGADQRAQMIELVDDLYEAQVKALLKDPYIAAKNTEAGLYGLTASDTILGELGAFQGGGGNVQIQGNSVNIDGSVYDFPDEASRDKFLREAGFSSEGGVSTTLGSLSAPYESGGDPGRVSTGAGDPGGVSYGTYQLTTNNVSKFISQSQYASAFQGLTPGTTAFSNKWKAIAAQDPEGFGEEQHAYIEKTHYDPQVQKLTSAGYNVNDFSPVLKDVIFSTAVQHGPATNIVLNAIKNVGLNSEEALIKEIYRLRWAGGANFANSSQAMRDGVYNRFFGANGEMNKALAMVDTNNYA